MCVAAALGILAPAQLDGDAIGLFGSDPLSIPCPFAAEIKCNNKFSNLATAEYHARVHKVRCSRCAETFENHRKLRVHEAFAHDLGTPCALARQTGCAKTFLDTASAVHAQREHSQRPICPYCHQVFSSLKALSPHVRIHLPDLFCSAPSCEWKCRSGQSMQKHVLTKHPGVAA